MPCGQERSNISAVTNIRASDSPVRRTWLWTLGVASGIALVAFAVRIGGALGFAFWQDEVGSAEAMLERTPIGVALHVARFESTPPGFYLLGWAIHNLGASLEQVRAVSALAGAVLAGWVVVFARRFMPLWAAATAGLSVALGYQFVFHGRELRAYELHALLCLALAWAAVDFAQSRDRRRRLVLALVVVAGSMTNYFFLLSLATVIVWCWALPRERSVRRGMTATLAVGLIPFLVWLPAMVKQYGHRGAYTYIPSFSFNDAVTTYWHEFVRAQPGAPVLHVTAPLLLLAAVGIGCWRLWEHSDAARLTALLATLPVLFAALIWAAGSDIYTVRNMIGVGPFAAIALGGLASSFTVRTGMIAVALGSVAIAYAYVHDDRVHPVPYDRVAEALVEQGWRPSDVIVLGGNFYSFRGPLEWYLPERPRLRLGEALGTRCDRIYVVATPSSSWYRRLAAFAPEQSRRIRGVLVARIDGRGADGLRRLLSRSRLLVTRSVGPGCAREVPETLLTSRIRPTPR